MTKLKLLITFFLLCSAAFGQSQNTTENNLTVQFAGLSYSGKLPFNQIVFVDSRFDTTKIGYFDKRKKHWKLKSEGGLANALNQTVNSSLKENFSADANQSVFVVIKDFWVSAPDANVVTKLLNRGTYSPFWILKLKLEIYGNQSERYTPLFRVDSAYNIDVFEEGKAVSLDVLTDCFKRLQTLRFDRIANAKTKLSKTAIDNFNYERFQKPVLENPVMQKGVFLSFSDFLNNKATYPEFDVELGNEIDNLYVVNSGTKELLAKFWGFCDGKDFYIKSGRNFYRLYRSGNTFEFFTDITYHYASNGQDRPYISNFNSPTDIGGGVVNYGLNKLIGRGHVEISSPYQVNMETGDVY